MQCQRIPAWQSCRASNAYNVSHALQAAFSSAPQSQSDHVNTVEVRGGRLDNPFTRKQHGPVEEVRNDSKRLKLTRQDRMAHLVQPNDLTATLEAHRRWNRGMHKRRQEQGQGRLTFTESKGKEVKTFEESFQRLPGTEMTYRRFVPIAADMIGDSGNRIRTQMLPDTKEQSLVGRTEDKPEYISRSNPAPTNYARMADVIRQSTASRAKEAMQYDHHRMKAEMRALVETTATFRRLPRDSRRKPKMALALDYSPQAIPSISSHADSVFDVDPPWTTERRHFATVSGEDILNQQIDQFVSFMDMDSEEISARQAVADQLQQFVAQHPVGKSVDLQLFGSEVTGLANVTSDIDFCINHASNCHEDNLPRHLTRPMRSILSSLYDHPDWINTVGRWGKFPIISAQHKATGIDVQVVATEDTSPRVEATRRYLEQFPRLRKIYFIIRTMLHMRNLGDTFTGGLGSYATLMMIVGALKRHPQIHDESAANQLRHFLEFYSTFDTTKHGLTIEPRAHLFKKHRSGAWNLQAMSEAANMRGDERRAGQWKICELFEPQPWLLSLQDPSNSFNDLGRNAVAIKHVLRTIQFLHAKLEAQVLSIDYAGESASIPANSLLLHILGPCHIAYANRRQKIRDWMQSQNYQSRSSTG